MTDDPVSRYLLNVLAQRPQFSSAGRSLRNVTADNELALALKDRIRGNPTYQQIAERDICSRGGSQCYQQPGFFSGRPSSRAARSSSVPTGSSISQGWRSAPAPIPSLSSTQQTQVAMSAAKHYEQKHQPLRKPNPTSAFVAPVTRDLFRADVDTRPVLSPSVDSLSHHPRAPQWSIGSPARESTEVRSTEPELCSHELVPQELQSYLPPFPVDPDQLRRVAQMRRPTTVFTESGLHNTGSIFESPQERRQRLEASLQRRGSLVRLSAIDDDFHYSRSFDPNSSPTVKSNASVPFSKQRDRDEATSSLGFLSMSGAYGIATEVTQSQVDYSAVGTAGQNRAGSGRTCIVPLSRQTSERRTERPREVTPDPVFWGNAV